MSTKILIAGGTGFIGGHLTERLIPSGYDVSHLSRRAGIHGSVKTYRWSPDEDYLDEEALDANYIINLAGTGIADRRWTSRRKELIINSRIRPIQLLFEKFKDSPKLKGFITTSAIGYYGADRGDEVLNEDSSPTSHYISHVVQEWETYAMRFQEKGIPTTIIRTGIVLGEKGALPKIALPIRYGFGSPIGTGKQWTSWIHFDDLCGIFEKAIESDNFRGIVNGVAPNAVTNRELTEITARVLRRPLWMPNVPGIALRILFGQMADILLGGLRVSSDKVEEAGYSFRFETAEEAIRSIYSG